MGLHKGEIHGGVYTGTAICDKCGATEAVTSSGAKIQPVARAAGHDGPEWRHVGFKYRFWVACSNVCEGELNAIAKREYEKDKGAPTMKGPIVRVDPIEGTHEAAVAAAAVPA